MPATIYTFKLLRRGHVVPQGLQAWMGGLRCQDVMSAEFIIVSGEQSRDDPALRQAAQQGKVIVAVDGHGGVGRILGTPESPDASQPEVAAPLVVRPDALFSQVLQAMAACGARTAAVVQPDTLSKQPKILGVITDREIAAVTANTARLMS